MRYLVSSLPHRQLRNICDFRIIVLISSLPHRQLRNADGKRGEVLDVFTAAQAA